jgi:hypothetical protein
LAVGGTGNIQIANSPSNDEHPNLYMMLEIMHFCLNHCMGHRIRGGCLQASLLMSLANWSISLFGLSPP